MKSRRLSKRNSNAVLWYIVFDYFCFFLPLFVFFVPAVLLCRLSSIYLFQWPARRHERFSIRLESKSTIAAAARCFKLLTRVSFSGGRVVTSAITYILLYTRTRTRLVAYREMQSLATKCNVKCLYKNN